MQGIQTKAGSCAQNRTEQSEKVVVGGAKADWAQPGGPSAAHSVRTIVRTHSSPKQSSPSFPVLILAWFFFGCDRLHFVSLNDIFFCVACLRML